MILSDQKHTLLYFKSDQRTTDSLDQHQDNSISLSLSSRSAEFETECEALLYGDLICDVSEYHQNQLLLEGSQECRIRNGTTESLVACNTT